MPVFQHWSAPLRWEDGAYIKASTAVGRRGRGFELRSVWGGESECLLSGLSHKQASCLDLCHRSLPDLLSLDPDQVRHLRLKNSTDIPDRSFETCVLSYVCFFVLQKRRRRIDRSMIGEPTNFVHTAHVGSGDLFTGMNSVNSIQNQMQSKGGYVGEAMSVNVQMQLVDTKAG
ncbi:CDC42 small effector protein 2 [Labeo rohita]|uniref:CDC42 small effector protein 2 n=1 Tax=Labeo rohita TaxID=84645 RepID=A0ABQ8MB51_LABRO|nr:CDC42 small effector protein 2 [Labeo rohita]